MIQRILDHKDRLFMAKSVSFGRMTVFIIASEHSTVQLDYEVKRPVYSIILVSKSFDLNEIIFLLFVCSVAV